MAVRRTVQVARVCDIDEKKAAVDTIKIVLNGETLTEDVCAEHRDEFRRANNRFLSHARHSGVRRRRRKRDWAMGDESAKVRAWAARRGIEIAPKGPIPREVQEQYHNRRGRHVNA